VVRWQPRRSARPRMNGCRAFRRMYGFRMQLKI